MSTPKSAQENMNRAISMLDAVSSIAQAFSASVYILKHPLSEDDFQKLEEFTFWLKSVDKRYKDKYISYDATDDMQSYKPYSEHMHISKGE